MFTNKTYDGMTDEMDNNISMFPPFHIRGIKKLKLCKIELHVPVSNLVNCEYQKLFKVNNVPQSFQLMSAQCDNHL